MFGVPNAKYLAFGTSDENALICNLLKLTSYWRVMVPYLTFGTPDENALICSLLKLTSYWRAMVPPPTPYYMTRNVSNDKAYQYQLFLVHQCVPLHFDSFCVGHFVVFRW